MWNVDLHVHYSCLLADNRYFNISNLSKIEHAIYN